MPDHHHAAPPAPTNTAPAPNSKPVGILKPDVVDGHINNCASPRDYLGMAFSVSPRTTPKSVSIAATHDTISPLILGREKSVEDFNINCFREPRRPVVKTPRDRRLSGRASAACSPALKPLTPALLDGATTTPLEDGDQAELHAKARQLDQLVEQVSAWIKLKREKRSRKKRAASSDSAPHHLLPATPQTLVSPDQKEHRDRRASNVSEESVDLDTLEGILKQVHRPSAPHRQSVALRRKSSVIKKSLRKQSSAGSDTEYVDGDVAVPSCDVVLDNTKTLAYTGGAMDLSDESSSDERAHAPSLRDQDAWAHFKYEIVRLAHTLRLKGWRKVPMERSNAVTVQRLSGALTNAVYVVSPPCDLPLQKEDSQGNVLPVRPPQPLLLRIYGPQVEHLIDRESELAILRRLARKRIGPRMLGTFANGRFEEFFHARTLCADDLRNADTSRQIAKRMRELHDGVELLEEERTSGPTVWRNWDKWLARAEKIVTWMDAQVQAQEPGVKPTGERAWMRRGLICGVPWSRFREAVLQYRTYLLAQYGPPSSQATTPGDNTIGFSSHGHGPLAPNGGGVLPHLIFAHNDTQYGNILRLMPTSKSPLLLPANTHKQLVVIDFEYASPNTRGQEFANHFTEWCYNYHDKRKPYACNANRYPTREQQECFIRAYVRHKPQYHVLGTPRLQPVANPGGVTTSAAVQTVADDQPGSLGEMKSEHSSKATVSTLSHSTKTSTTSAPTAQHPAAPPTKRSTTSISDYMLDARNPGAHSTQQPSLHSRPAPSPSPSSSISSSTALLQPQQSSSTTKSDPTAPSATTSATADHHAEDAEVARLLHETRLWRIANSAMWIAWGIVQAKIPGLPDFSDECTDRKPSSTIAAPTTTNLALPLAPAAHVTEPSPTNPATAAAAAASSTTQAASTPANHPTPPPSAADTNTATTTSDADHEDAEFDYLGYVQHRALLFWGDALQCGLVRLDELSPEFRERIKIVPY